MQVLLLPTINRDSRTLLTLRFNAASSIGALHIMREKGIRGKTRLDKVNRGQPTPTDTSAIEPDREERVQISAYDKTGKGSEEGRKKIVQEVHAPQIS